MLSAEMSGTTLNFNVGVLGHIDSGKTTLSKALSSIASTAAFDRNPQSQERGITIDLGFSSFCVEIPDHIKAIKSEYETLQFTLVDCPGHASLMKTIIGGSQIIDMMMLVVDVMKGIQTQTAECLVLGEITCNRMIIVLNKIDLIPEEKRESSIQKMSKKILKTLEKTKFHDSAIVSVSVKSDPENLDVKPIGVDKLIDSMKQHSYLPSRSAEGAFVFAVDHCFAIKGQGTVMTGTVIQGSVSVGDTVDIPVAKITKKIKSIQMFKKPIVKAIQGDRIGICVTQFEAKLLERGAICSPGYMDIVDIAIATVHKIPYFKFKCPSKSKFHISIMHDTIVAKCSFFGTLDAHETDKEAHKDFNYDSEYIHLDEMQTGENETICNDQFVLLEFERPVILSRNSIYIGSRLELDIHSNICRLAFHGNILEIASKKQSSDILTRLKVFKEKLKEGVVDRMVNEYQIIAKDIFKKETNIQPFLNLKVMLSSGEEGFIEGSFGQSGKVNIRIPNGLSEDTISKLKVNKKGKKDEQSVKVKEDNVKVTLKFKKLIHSNKKHIYQSK